NLSNRVIWVRSPPKAFAIQSSAGSRLREARPQSAGARLSRPIAARRPVSLSKDARAPVSQAKWWRSEIPKRRDLSELEPVEPGVDLVGGQELGVGADGLDRAAVHDDDFVRTHDRREAVGDHDGRRAL